MIERLMLKMPMKTISGMLTVRLTYFKCSQLHEYICCWDLWMMSVSYTLSAVTMSMLLVEICSIYFICMISLYVFTQQRQQNWRRRRLAVKVSQVLLRVGTGLKVFTRDPTSHTRPGGWMFWNTSVCFQSLIGSIWALTMTQPGRPFQYRWPSD